MVRGSRRIVLLFSICNRYLSSSYLSIGILPSNESLLNILYCSTGLFVHLSESNCILYLFSYLTIILTLFPVSFFMKIGLTGLQFVNMIIIKRRSKYFIFPAIIIYFLLTDSQKYRYWQVINK